MNHTPPIFIHSTGHIAHRPRILIVDDVLTNVQYLLDALKEDYQVNFELSGKAGIEFAHQYRPDLILLDAMMPEMDGFSVCAQLRAHAETSAIPIIIVTSLDSPEDEARALEIGASDFMPKSVNLAVLRARVRTQLTMKRQGDMLRSLTLADPLTGLSNRRALDATIAKEWRRCARSQVPLSMILADLDHFKSFNDAYGHPAGDDCLKAVAKVFIQAAQRPQDLVARYGGEEFVILLPEVDLLGAEIVAGGVMVALKTLNMAHAASDTGSRVTTSMGVASIVPGMQAPEILLSTADTFLYRAKNLGRDQFVSGMVGV
ncbi:diguanylate cyclase [Herminiimonas contaminans]|uniref:diguanylate cyclase n=1 Tax=Herminiimonas contaminans TaxID=1111140 RepID=A0ABS0EWH5_9BURK|nr:diguanylate cyclase [Herminiimonas contaminans]MBF8179105.1 diguanylate cyclase [Herminiimonas contaminans]